MKWITLHPARCTLHALIIGSLFGAPAVAQEEIPDNPRRRWEALYRERAFPFDRIPAGARERARLQLRGLQASLLAAPPPIAGTQWQPIGPEQLPTVSMGSIGRLTAIAIDPTNSAVIYVGGAQGGVWKTVNGGASWVPLTDGECSLAMGSIAIDPVDTDILYAGTGEQHFSADSYYGCGVLRSEDGGSTWTQLGTTEFLRAKISRLVIDQSTAGTVATTRVHVASDNGLYRSEDGGATWSLRLSGTFTDLVIDPSNQFVLYAAQHSTGIFKSADGGTSWVPVNSGFGTSVARINLAIAASAPDTLYASAQSGTGSDLAGIWRTTNRAATWSQLSATGASCGNQCWYDQTIAVAPDDPSVVYFGGVSLYKSTDGGSTFNDIRSGIHVDQHYITFDPADSLTVFVGNDGGIFRSTNGGTSWTSLNTNLALTQFYSGISLHPTNPLVVLGGTQDNGTLEWNGAPAWDWVLGGDGGFTAIDQQNPITRYGETQWTTNSGFAGPRRSDGGSFQRKVTGIDESDRALFIPPIVMDPVDSRTLYFGTFRIYKTTDRAETWTPISSDITAGGRISAIAPAATNRGVIYTGASDGTVRRTNDSGGVWSLITQGLPVRHIKDIAVDRADWQTAYLVVSGFGTGHVFRTTNAGATWQDGSGNLPDIPVNAVVADPTDRGTAIIGTDLGVFITSDTGATWTPLTNGMPNVAVFDIAYNVNTGVLIAGTHGRGMFSLQLDRPLTLVVTTRARIDSAVVGDTDVRTDSANVILSGLNAATAGWSATAGASWVSVTTGSGTGSGVARWTRDPTGLAAGTYVDTITVAAAGAADSPWDVVDTLVVQGALTVALDVTSRNDTLIFGTTPSPDSATVMLSGVGAGAASWAAAHGAGTWLTLIVASGTGSGTLRWERDPFGLAGGTYVDTIAVTVPGAAGSPAALVDTMVISQPQLVVNPPSRLDSATLGSTAILLDSADVLINAPDADTTTWWAVNGGAAEWFSFVTDSGLGSGVVRWARDPSVLVAEGIALDTIHVMTRFGSALLHDSLLITPPAMTLSADSRLRNAQTGTTAPSFDSVDVVLRGLGNDTASWTARHGTNDWLTFLSGTGTGDGRVRWRRDPSDLGSDTYADTIVVLTSRGDTAVVVDTFSVSAPTIDASCAVQTLLAVTCLNVLERRVLDLDGNRDGTFNLGDFLALRARAAQTSSSERRP